MKQTLIFIALMTIGVTLKAAPPLEQRPVGKKASDQTVSRKHVITIPPWVNMKDYSHAMAKKDLQDFLSKTPGTETMRFDDSLETNEPLAGGNAFVAELTDGQVNALKKDFVIPGGKVRESWKTQLFVSPLIEFTPLGGGKDYTTKTVNQRTWAAEHIVPNPLTLAQQNGVPVLYVVDTGVQPFVPDSSTASQWNWHPELRIAATTGNPAKLRLRQGRVAAGMGALWPKLSAPAPWNTNYPAQGQGVLLNFTPTTLKPFLPTPPASPYNIDPYMDTFNNSAGHGTRVAGTAIGAAIGVLGRFNVGGAPVQIEVESIRIYPNDNTITPTNSLVVSDGIYKAVNEHVARATVSGVPSRSVLLFASRSISGFAENVEIALWWAWYKGMIVVVSGGNEPGEPTNYATLHAPNCYWYSSGAAADGQTTPSRFDSATANQGTNALLWPNPTSPSGQMIPYPNRVYMLIAGGNNIGYDGSAYTGDSGPRKDPTTGAIQTSIGPDIDISAPSLFVPGMVPNQDVNGVSGTSFSAGYVAGAALAYLASKTTVDANTPDAFRTWLLPSAGPNGAPACDTSVWDGWPGPGGHPSHHINAAYNGLIPELKITTAPAP